MRMNRFLLATIVLVALIHAGSRAGTFINYPVPEGVETPGAG
jgi:hypothetical protein